MNEHAEVDIDRLADYIGGALDDADAAEVTRLVAEDPRWRETYDLLAPGMAEVGAELQALGPEPMPADVAARIDAALGSPIAEPTVIDPALATPSEPHLLPVGEDRGHLHVVRGAGADRPARRRRRPLRWAAPIAAAAGVLAFAAVGIDHLAGPAADDVTSAAGSADQAGPLMESQGLVTAPPDDRIVTTGTDYTTPTLGGEAATTMGDTGASRGAKRKAYSQAPAMPQSETDPLARLRLPEALMACLEAIARQRGANPITVQAVEYARFEGAPAVIVRFVADGATWAVAAGPECGTRDRGAGLLETLRVG